MDDTIREIFSLYEVYGNTRNNGELISIHQHASQTAQLATKEGFDDEVVVAAFLHRIGELIKKQAIDSVHEPIEKHAAEFLRSKYFPEEVAAIIENQLTAKRYLSKLYPTFFIELSELSKRHLKEFGGPLSAQEARDFELNDYFRPSVRLAIWSERSMHQYSPGVHFSIVEAKARNLVRIDSEA